MENPCGENMNVEKLEMGTATKAENSERVQLIKARTQLVVQVYTSCHQQGQG